MAYDIVLLALADPTRRTLFEQVRRRPRTVGELARFAGVRQPTVSQHLQVLRRARLVKDRREGTRRYYQADRTGLAELREYLETMWDDVLAAYAASDPARQSQPSRSRQGRGRGGR